MIGINSEKPSTICRLNNRELNPMRTPKNNDRVLRWKLAFISIVSVQVPFFYPKNASHKDAKTITPPCINN